MKKQKLEAPDLKDIKAENLRLNRELEQKNKELEIEAALERVRSRTLGMHNSDELKEVVAVLYEQLHAFGLAAWGCSIMIFNEEANRIENWVAESTYSDLNCYYVKGQKHPVYKKLWQNWKKQGPTFTLHHEDEVKREFDEYWLYETGFNTLPDAVKSTVLNEREIFLTYATMRHGFLSAAGYQRLPDEKVTILERVAKVFEQTYTRFLDLQKAEAQAREAQIEAALERVRSRSLAMHKTAELQSVIHTVHQELLNLNISISGGSFIVINNEIDTELQCWGSGGTADTSDEVHIPRFEKPFYTNLLNGIKNGPGFFTEEYTREEKIEFFTFLFRHEPWSKLDSKQKAVTLSAPGGYTRSCTVSKHTSIFIINHSGEKFSAAENDILIRFGKVFEQAYTRFLDLQKAEAQALEAQIEAALERVRSRTMAMQSSSELGAVAAELFAQMNQLVTNLWTCGFVLCEKNRDEDEWWLSMDGDFTRGFFLPNIGDYAHATLYEGWLKGDALRAVQLDGETLQQHYDWLMEIPVSRAIFEEMDAAGLVRPDWQKLHAAYFSKGYLVLITREPCGEEEIFKRFAQVFDQTYTRFLDLQKAEAQAREAQVNLAVERVRARALAMFKSEEILQVMNKLKDEIMGLDIPNVAAATIHLKEPDGMCRVWDLTSLELNDEGLHLPLDIRFRLEDTDPDFFMRRVWENEADYFVVIQEEADFKHTIQWLHDNGLNKQANETEEFFKSTQLKKVYHPTAPLNNGRMCIDLLDTPSPEIASILKKMAGAFDLAYKRFEDLQKAEAQTREAQIETALERVRSRTMAMYKSEELLYLVKKLYKEIEPFRVSTTGISIALFRAEENAIEYWFADNLHSDLLQSYKVEGQKNKVFKQTWDDWKNNNAQRKVYLEGQDKKDFDNYILEETDFRKLPEELKQDIHSHNTVCLTFTFFKYGYFESVDLTIPAQENAKILFRFAKVFEQTYTRFLDLQKAEAQAREVKIELALEKVRARTMAMHQSSELAEAGNMVFQQIKHLGIHAETSWFWFINLKSDTIEIWTTHENKIAQSVRVKASDYITFKRELDAWKNQEPFVKLKIPKQDAKNVLHDIFGIELNSNKEATHFHLLQIYHNNGFLGIGTWSEATEEEMKICTRFAKVFDQTYTRFLDLQKAEEQAREAQVEASLERVRARMMAMHKTDELHEVLGTIFTQLQSLGVYAPGSALIIYNHDLSAEHWMTGFSGDYPESYKIPYVDHPYFTDLLKAWKDGVPFAKFYFEGDLKIEYARWCLEHSDFKRMPPEFKKEMLNPDRMVISDAFNKYGMIEVLGPEPLSKEASDVLTRFSKVFEQTYTRFLDLQKAEAQAREAHIEAALERVRSRSMAMHNSENLIHVATEMNQQFNKLGITQSLQAGFVLLDEEKELQYLWGGQTDSKLLKFITIPLFGDHVLQTRYEAWKRKDPVLNTVLASEDLRKHMEVVMPAKGLSEREMEASNSMPDPCYFCCGNFKYGYLIVISTDVLTEEQQKIVARMAKVFEQTYTRFLDIQKAEAQTREAQIELGLERVRARAMAMQESGELSDLVATLLQELTKLDFSLTFCIINVYNVPDNSNMVWAANPEEGKAPESYDMKFEDYPFHHAMMREWKSQTPKFVYIMEGEEKAIYDDYLYTKTEFRRFPEEVQKANRALDKYVATFVFSHFGGLQTVGNEPLSDESIDILYRFGKVFDLTYTRFNDLKKAEEQAHEAKIEAALERVRSRSMAMHKSEELRSVVSTLYGELQSLQVNFHVVAIQLIPDDSMDLHLWLGTADGLYDDIIHWPYINIPVFHELYRVRTTGEIFEYTLSEADTRVFFDEYFKLDGVPQGRKTATQNVKLIDFTGAFQKLTGIFLMRYTEGSYSSSEKDIIRRFSKVFEQTYTRFLDLQKAEAQALEAIKRASVDRVRAEIASMRTITDLDRIQPLIWNELKILGVPFTRCGVFIMDEAKQEVEAFLSTPDGKSIAAFRLSYSSTEQSKQIVSHWQQKHIFKDHMDEAAFAEFTQNLVQQGAVARDEKYVTENRPTDLYLHFLPFLQGMMYVGNTAPLKEDELQLVQNLADAFSTAYARYEDFNNLEAAKAAVDSAMGTLKATQAQLVQQEKLASLGQLTAGIAHEIKNPLNFVNNFTEVSIELMDEALVEIQKNGDQKDNALINHNLEDIRSNLKKVHGHSTRANSIVNSMLMHSRAGTGRPEPTLLNDFIREYCNLAFHGMRAGNNPLNVHMILDLDERVKEIPIIAEDFSRVVLNICNNAFDAMRNTHLPKLTIRTQLQNDYVLIQFKDNGPGIPDEIRDKILQPFFTTKKGKEGTGLGLSITNDIVKAHRGELTIDSQPGEGAAFIIHLPM